MKVLVPLYMSEILNAWIRVKKTKSHLVEFERLTIFLVSIKVINVNWWVFKLIPTETSQPLSKIGTLNNNKQH